MKESDIEGQVCSAARDKDILVYKFTSPGIRGVPDRMFVYMGQVMFIEFKSAKGVLSTFQKRQIQRIREQKVNVAVIYNVSEGLKEIEAFKRRCTCHGSDR